MGEGLSNKNTFLREDYREFLELTLVYLSGELPARIFFLQHPRAMHHARFMSKAIYLLKMELITERITVTAEKRRQVHRLAQIIALFYAKYFLLSRIAVFSPLEVVCFVFQLASC